MARHLVRQLCALACMVGHGACGFPPPPGLRSDAGGTGDASVSNDGSSQQDINPSNGLAPYLDMAAIALDVDLGTTATINTDDGSASVDGNPVVLRSAVVAQTVGPAIRVFIAHSVIAKDVTVTGSNAVAIASSVDVTVGGTFAAPASGFTAGPGGFNDSACRGQDGQFAPGGMFSGSGGGGFGGAGASGGTLVNPSGTFAGGQFGTFTGNVELVPLRGGCDSGNIGPTGFHGGGGGAIQLVSRTRIVVSGVVAASGSAYGGGGSGGGILLEAPSVQITGNVVANGAGGDSGCVAATDATRGESGHLDTTPAAGGTCSDGIDGFGGSGGTRDASPHTGMSVNVGKVGSAGFGGGGVGRIRINTFPGGLTATGVFSPNPSTGTLATR